MATAINELCRRSTRSLIFLTRRRHQPRRKLVGRTLLASELRIWPQRISEFVERGMPRVARGKYDLDRCLAWRLKDLRQRIRELDRKIARLQKASDRNAKAICARLGRELVDGN